MVSLYMFVQGIQCDLQSSDGTADIENSDSASTNVLKADYLSSHGSLNEHKDALSVHREDAPLAKVC